MPDHLRSTRRFTDETSNVPHLPLFDRLRVIQDELFARVRLRFSLQRDPSTTRFQPYISLDGSAKGALAGFSGPEIDWLIYSWIGNPSMSFCTIRLTVWLGPQLGVPHLTFTFGTLPVLFFLIDYVPRVDVMLNPDYLDCYLEPANKRVLELHADKRLSPYLSQSMFMRQMVSQAGLNFICPAHTEEIIELIRSVSHEYLDRWLAWVEKAERVPETECPVLANRDLTMRRIMAEHDPGNAVAARIYGPELANALIRGLWGGDRVIARPGGG